MGLRVEVSFTVTEKDSGFGNGRVRSVSLDT